MDTDEEAFCKEVGARLRAARNNHGLSLEQVAAHLGKVKQTVSSWEKGVNPIDTKRLHQLARLYQTPIAAFLIDRLSKDELFNLVSGVRESEAPPAPPIRKQRGARP